MNKKYYIAIGILSLLSVLLVLLVSMISLTNINNLRSKNITNTTNQDQQTEQQEEQEKPYTGEIKCEILDRNDKIYKSYFIENIEIENDKVKTNETKNKIIYKNAENYKGFKENETVLNPVYDDENLTIEYTFNEKYELSDEDMESYIKNLTDYGYKCEKVITN